MKIRYRLCIGLCLAALVILNGSAVSRADNDEYIDGLRESISEKEGELDGLEGQRAALQNSRSNLQRIVNNLEATKNEMSAYVAELDAQVADIQGNIDSLNELIETKEAEIVQTQAELVQAEQVAAEQYEAMKERIQFMYERGDTLYLEMLLDADSFADMLNKADYIEQLSAYDREKLEEYQLVIEYTQLCQQELISEQELLEEARAVAEEEQNNLNALIDEKEIQISAYESDIATNEQAIREYDEEIAEQNSIIAALEAQIAADQAALAEATRLKYDGGIFTWPAPSYTRISDPFGWRMHPTLKVEKFHNGIDMAAPGGSPILAAYDGRVVAAAYSSSMGNYIMIDHGDKLYTIYMHASALYVSTGDYVTRGQKIAAVGTTGRSTGNHLHFGVRLNGQYVDPNIYL